MTYLFLSWMQPLKNIYLPTYTYVLQNQEMIAEGDLAIATDQSNKIREMQDKISHLRAQVRTRN